MSGSSRFTGRRAVELRGWTLSGADRRAAYRFGRLRLTGRASVRVHSGAGRDTARDVYQDRHTYALRNTADTVTLRDSRGRLVDVESWGRSHAAASHHGGRR